MRRIVKLLSAIWLGSVMLAQADRLYVNDKRVPETHEDIMAIQSALQENLEQARAATVCIKVGKGSGTGVIISEDGLVLTAAHVVTGVKKEMRVIMEDGTEYPAKSLGLHSENDAAMLRIVSKEKFPYVKYEASSEDGRPKTKLGDWVFAIGHSGGFSKERGSVVRLGRLIRIAKSTIQSDCKLIGGDSGGPLFDMNGVLVGIHSRVGTNLSQNMHVPLQVFHKHWADLAEGEFVGNGPFANRPKPGSGFMGMNVKEVEAGLEVIDLAEGYPAAEAGLQLGDIIVSMNAVEVETRNGMLRLLRAMSEGDRVELAYLREGEKMTVGLSLVKR